MMGGVAAIEEVEAELQRVMLAALRPSAGGGRDARAGAGRRLRAGGIARRVAHMESYVGLVEGCRAGAGCGGLTYIARRAAENAAASTGKDLLPFLTEGFTAAALPRSAPARSNRANWATCCPATVIVPHKDELLQYRS